MPYGYHRDRMKLTNDDRWDSGPSRNPYPRMMPSLENPTMGSVPIHTRALMRKTKIVHEGKVYFADPSTNYDLEYLQDNMYDMYALTEELSIGVVLPSPEDAEILALDPYEGLLDEEHDDDDGEHEYIG